MITGIIPARYASTRFPGKPLVDIHGKSMLQRVYEQCLKSKLDRLVVATDDERIIAHVKYFSGEAILTATSHKSGTDRIAEAADKLKLQDDGIVVNIQGDEPLITARWEYTKQERLGMSEIEDGAFAIMETGRLMAQTLPRYKFYADIAAQTFTKTSPTADEVQKLNLVQVPNSVRTGTIQKTYEAQRLVDLDIPSPYLNGFFDDMIANNPDIKWSTTLETNRGCPFKCSFCDWGMATNDKVYRFNKQNLLERDDYSCQYCGKKMPVKELNMDHVIPRDRGGNTTWENIVISCVTCNSKKSNRLPKEAGMRLMKEPKRPPCRPFMSTLYGKSMDKTWSHFIQTKE